MSPITISIDAIGGDNGLKVTIPASILAIKKYTNLSVILVGNKETIFQNLKKINMHNHPRISICHAEQVVDMNESPVLAIRNKKESSMRIAINLLDQNKASACVSAGNTGALMAIAKFVLQTVPGIKRPAIISSMPSINEKTQKIEKVYMLDLGANIYCSPNNLIEFSIMASSLVSSLDNIKYPRISLLNIGKEENKGIELIQKTAKELKKRKDINYIGFIEGKDLFFNRTDIIVCDGFTGNIALKSIEGTSKLISSIIKNVLNETILNKIFSMISFPILWKIKKKCDIRLYNGANFLGLRKVVIKSHGSSDEIAYFRAIEKAINAVKKDIPKQIFNCINNKII